ncbi:MAG: hypothetical protein ACREBR_01055, partial [bacterium]
ACIYIELEFVEFIVVAFYHHRIPYEELACYYSGIAKCDKRTVYLTSVVTSYTHTFIAREKRYRITPTIACLLAFISYGTAEKAHLASSLIATTLLRVRGVSGSTNSAYCIYRPLTAYCGIRTGCQDTYAWCFI